MEDRLAALITYCRDAKRVCPTPSKWKELWEILPGKQRNGNQSIPPLPLILAGWWHSTDQQKAERFEEHCRWAASHGAFDRVDAWVRGLNDSDWHKTDQRW